MPTWTYGGGTVFSPVPESTDMATQAELDAATDYFGLGHVEDDTGLGHVRSQLTLSDMAFVPFRDGAWASITPNGGGGATFYPPGPTGGGEAAPRGPGGLVYFNFSSDSLAGVGGITLTFKGRGLGIAYRNAPPSTGTPPTMNAVIDGECFRVPKPSVYFDGTPQTANTASENLPSFLIAGDLPDREHTLKLLLNANSTDNTRLLLYGLFLDNRWYRDEPFTKVASLVPVTVPLSGASALALPSLPAALSTPAVGAQTDRKFRYFERLDFLNNDTADDAVNIYRLGVLIDTLTIPAGRGASWPRNQGSAVGIDGYTVRRVAAAPATSGRTIDLTLWGRP